MDTAPQVSDGSQEAAGPAIRAQTRGFLFADLRGYTEFVDRRGDVAAARVIKRYRAIVRQAVAQFDGAEIRTEGDGFYVVFDSASSAVRCGLAIIEGAARDRAEAPDDPIRVAIGIHAGETADTAEGYVGSAINTAARIASVASEGELLVSDTVRSLTRTLMQVGFVSRRSVRLKGLSEPIHLYRVVPASAGGDVRGGRVAGRLSATPWRVAAAAIVVGGLAAAAIIFAQFMPGPAPPASPTGPASPSQSTGASSGPPPASPVSAPERALLDRLPGSIRDSCVPDAQRGPGVDARWRCDLPLGTDADTVWYEHYQTRPLLDVAIGAIEREEGLEPGSCALVAKASDSWKTPLETFSGRRLCYPRQEASWLVWTYDADLIVATATRRDVDWTSLFSWWTGVGPFLRGD
jgi:class 3 adenylate cyclase